MDQQEYSSNLFKKRSIPSGSDVIISAVTRATEDFAEDDCYKEGVTIIPIMTLGFQNCDLFFDKVFTDEIEQITGFKYFNEFKSIENTTDVLLGKAEGRVNDKEKDLDIAIAISMEPSILLACTTSIPIDVDEMEVANRFKNGELTLVNTKNGLKVPEADIILEGKILVDETAEEGPFVDLTDTYDLVRQEPVIKLSKMYFKKDEALHYHAILPAGFEHKLLQGLPQEPRIYNAVKNTVPTVQNVVLTEGGCCWLHAAVSIKKQTHAYNVYFTFMV